MIRLIRENHVWFGITMAILGAIGVLISAYKIIQQRMECRRLESLCKRGQDISRKFDEIGERRKRIEDQIEIEESLSVDQREALSLEIKSFMDDWQLVCEESVDYMNSQKQKNKDIVS